MNTKPPVDPSVRSVWTNDEEARWKELDERRGRIRGENIQRINELLTGYSDSLPVLLGEWMMDNAEAVRDVLKPFDRRAA